MKEISLPKKGIKNILFSRKKYFFLGAALSQLFALGTSFYILKFANAAVYGKFSYFLSIAFIIGSISTLKFEQAIVISNNRKESNYKFNLTILTSIWFSAVLILFIYFLSEPLDILSYILIFILSISIALNASLQQAFLYLEKHISNGLLSTVYAGLNLLLVILLIRKESGLQISYTLAYLLTGMIFSFIVLKSNFHFQFYSIKTYFRLFKKNFSYFQFIFPGAILTILLTYGHPIFIKHLYNETDLGLFSLSLRILLLPSILVGAILGGFFRKKLSVLYMSRKYLEIQKEGKNIIKYLFLVAVLIYPLLLLTLNQINKLLKLSGWENIGTVSSLLLFYALSQYFYVPLSNIALVCNKKDLLFRLNILQFAITLFVYGVAYFLQLNFFTFMFLLSLFTSLFSLYAAVKLVSIPKNYLC